ncbi:DUF805 domain-containing protein [Jannaschia ovalis]|uniref:DUF805 domain-containing protein n=1 Tax=Jannaschia ovalis TaxID=3038773 RepID=A0ABY8LEC7_9RHOB|nr:DUF805 domain-containing protein [Jannaschia sp. GRR-S6-38]WGH79516.1 DUF805 domain-containing protein [Jannaschia sp. GRR-S6-38]
MGFSESVRHVLGNYVTFAGRAPRSEFWWFQLFYFMAGFVAGALDAVVFGLGPESAAVFAPLLSLGLLLPSLAVLARRLHDIDRTAWWILLFFVPVVGAVVILIFAVLRGTEGPNRFGPDPLGGPGAGTGGGGAAYADDVRSSSVPTVGR